MCPSTLPATQALLAYMTAHITGLKPGNFVGTLRDAHIYLNHVEMLKMLKMLLKVEAIDDLRPKTFRLRGTILTLLFFFLTLLLKWKWLFNKVF